MNLFAEALAWLFDGANWQGDSSIVARISQHLAITAAAIGIASVVALPAGIITGHTRKGSGVIGAVAGAARAVPTLGILTLAGLAFGIGFKAPLVALVALAVPSLLAGSYAGMQAINPTVPEAAKAVGMAPWQVVVWVEVPLSLPVLIGGLRAATLQVVATATLAAYTADIGLGRYLFAGLKTRDYAQMLGGAVLVAALALLLELFLAGLQRAATKRFVDPASG